MEDGDGEEILHQGDEPKTIYLEYLNSDNEWVSIAEAVLQDGKAEFEFTRQAEFDLTNGVYTISVRFDGDNRYHSTVTEGTLTIADNTAPRITHLYRIDGHKLRVGDVRDNFDCNPKIEILADGVPFEGDKKIIIEEGTVITVKN